jgi:hypothetical protein
VSEKFLRDPPDKLLRRINIFEFKGEWQVSRTRVQEHMAHHATLAETPRREQQDVVSLQHAPEVVDEVFPAVKLVRLRDLAD